MSKTTFIHCLRTMVNLFAKGSIDDRQMAVMFANLLSLYSADFQEFQEKDLKK